MRRVSGLLSRSVPWTLLGTLFVMTAIIVPERAQAAEQKPNILYIVADDQGWKDVGFHGSDIRTPQLDKLAENGVQFEQFYSEPMCTPSRAAMMTGRTSCPGGSGTVITDEADGQVLVKVEKQWETHQMSGQKTVTENEMHYAICCTVTWLTVI